MIKLSALICGLILCVSLTAQNRNDSTFYSLTQALKNPESVKVLILKGQDLESFPQEILQLPYLEELNLSDNPLLELHPDLGQLARLKKVDLSENKLLMAPTVVRQLESVPNLKELDLSNCQLAFLSYRIGRLSRLEKLNLSQNQLQSLPPELFYLPQLRELDCSNNRIEKLPPEVEIIGQLIKLNLSGNPNLQLESAVRKLKDLESLRILTIGPIQKERLPLHKLGVETLEIYGGSQRKLVASLKGNESIRQLKIQRIGRGLEEEEWENLANLSQLNNLQVQCAPTEIHLEKSTFEHLAYLSVESPRIISLHTSPRTSRRLESLRVRSGHLPLNEDMVIELSQLRSLKELDVSGCDLAELPENFFELNNLVVLQMEHNRFRSLEPLESSFESLQQLTLSGNPLESVTLDRLDTLYPDCDIAFQGMPYSTLLQQDKKINPPIPELAPQPESYTYEPEKASQITTPAGYRFDLPAQALVDANGQPISGEVTLKITEYNDAVSLALGGIPMTFGNGEEVGSLSSQAMFDISVEADQEVFINPENPILVSLPVSQPRDGDELYVFDTTAGVWVKPESDTAQAQALDLNMIESVRLMLGIALPEGPYLQAFDVSQECLNFTVKRDRNKDSFTIALKKEPFHRKKLNKGFGEYRAIRGAKWVYEGPDAEQKYRELDSLSHDLRRYYKKHMGGFFGWRRITYKPAFYTDMKLTTNPAGDNFRLSLASPSGDVELTVFPEFGSSRHDREAQLTQRMYKQYQHKHKHARKAWIRIEQMMEQEEERFNTEWTAFEQEIERYDSLMKPALESTFDMTLAPNFSAYYFIPDDCIDVSKTSILTNRFQIRNFGLCNIDRFYQNKNPEIFVGNLVDSNGIMLEPSNLTLIDFRRKNTLQIGRWKHYLPIAQNQIVGVIAVLDEGETLGVIPSYQVRNLELKNRDAQAEMQLFNVNDLDGKELRRILR